MAARPSVCMVTINSTDPASAPARMLHCTSLSHRCGARSNSHSTGSANAKRSSFSSSELLHTPRTADVVNIQASGSSSTNDIGHKAPKFMGSYRLTAFITNAANAIGALR
ncbi:hypothetical protein D3C72_2022050 [compost metagenome]